MDYTIIYDRSNVTVLGTENEAEHSECIENTGNRCFNCGSPQHIVSRCSEPFNRPLVALSRAMNDFFKAPGKRELERVHEYEVRKLRHLRFAEFFQPGSICGGLLREALGMDRPDRNGSERRDYPWLWRMLDWGYPPGWVSAEDPKHKILARIEGEGMWTELDAMNFFGHASQTSSVEHLSASSGTSAQTETWKAYRVTEQSDGTQRRWAYYPTTLFSSEHFAVYSGTPLPSEACLVPRQVQHSPPWRRSDAFSAFGPAAWQEYIRYEKYHCGGY